MKKNIEDDAKVFEKQYPVAKLIVFKYLEGWFKTVFETKEFKKSFGNEDIYVTLAAQVLKYLFGEDIGSIPKNIEPKVKDQMIRVQPYIAKWADDSMTKDKDFCEFVIETLRMDMIFSQYFSNMKYDKSEEGKRKGAILMKYGNRVKKAPNPKTYTKLIEKWVTFEEWKDKQSGKIN